MPGAADGDALALAARQPADDAVDADAARAEDYRRLHDLFGDLLLGLHVDEAEAVLDRPPDEEVPPQWLLLAERTVLIDGLDLPVVSPADGVSAGLHVL